MRLVQQLASQALFGAVVGSVACHARESNRDEPGGDPAGRPDETGTSAGGSGALPPTEDSGNLPEPAPAATWSSHVPDAWEGQVIEAGVVDGTPVALVSAQLYQAYPTIPGFVSALTVSSDAFTWRGAVQDSSDDPPLSHFGNALAIAADGSAFLVGALDANRSSTSHGLVYLLATLPDGAVAASPSLLLAGDVSGETRFGCSVSFMDTDGAGQDVVTGTIASEIELQGMIHRFDRDLTGEHGLGDAAAAIAGSYRMGQYLASWDSDGDGLEEVVTSADSGVVHFASPWNGNLAQDDADAEWTDASPENQVGEPLETVGDLNGDGLSELAIGAQSFNSPEFRSGRLFLVNGGPLGSMSAVDIPTQFQGVLLAEGVGSAATFGDYDADGTRDLIVGAYHVNNPYEPGTVLGYLGPLGPGIRTSLDADFVAIGQDPLESFGCDVATVDADGDLQADIVVGAQSANAEGKVYLFLGRDLVP
jgi:hypothetical protein